MRAFLISVMAILVIPQTTGYVGGYNYNYNYNNNYYNSAYANWYRNYYNSYYAQRAAAPAAKPDPDWTYTCVTAPPAAYNLCTYGSHAYMPLKEVFKGNAFMQALLG